MITGNFTPEQKAKFMTGNKMNNFESPISSIQGSEEKQPNVTFNPPKFKRYLPIVLGVLVAMLFIYLGVLYYQNNGVTDLLNPWGSKGSEDMSNKFVNPLTGEIVPLDQAADWKDKRPIGVMMNNHIASRPQSGLVDADVVYEIVAEGGITRYLAFFLSKLPEKIGTVRSTREYYLVLVKEMGDAMLMHIGWSPQALIAIETWPVRSLGRGGAQFTRDQARINAGIPIEHTAYVNGPYLRQLSIDLGWEGTSPTFESWKFKDEGPVDKTQQCLIAECDKPLIIDFWYKGDYTGAFKYDRNTNSYLRFTGYDANDQLQALIDPETKKQVTVKNVVVQFVAENSIAGDDKNRLDYQLIGSGQTVVFRDGQAIKGIWRKESRDGRTKFFDTSGQEIPFNRGKIWVSIVPDRNISQVTY